MIFHPTITCYSLPFTSYYQKYGCTGWTQDNLNCIVDIAFNRGIIEIGAGNGQWARAIRDHYQYILDTRTRQTSIQRFGKNSNFIIPYDDMSNLPLSPKIYHHKDIVVTKNTFKTLIEVNCLESWGY